MELQISDFGTINASDIGKVSVNAPRSPLRQCGTRVVVRVSRWERAHDTSLPHLQIKAGGDGYGLRLYDPVRLWRRRKGSECVVCCAPLLPSFSCDLEVAYMMYISQGYMNTAMCRSAISYIDGGKV